MPDGLDAKPTATPSIGNALREAVKSLEPTSDSPRIDATALLTHCLGLDQTALIAHAEKRLDPIQTSRFAHALKRRRRGEPVAYINGTRDFWTLTLEVDSNTLIPRPDTETLVEQALLRIPDNERSSVLDLGTGSGAIAIAVASERPLCDVTATDISAPTLAVAARNAERAQVQVSFVESDWFSALDSAMTARRRPTQFDVILSNPPYIASNDSHLDVAELQFEPTVALVSGSDGLDAIREIVREAGARLRLGGWLLVEHGYDQQERVAALMQLHQYHEVTTIQDLGGNPRVTLGQKQQVTP